MTMRTAIIKQDNWIINMYVNIDAATGCKSAPNFIATKTRKHWIISSNAPPLRNIILEREKNFKYNNVVTAYEKEDECRIDLVSMVINYKSSAPTTVKVLLPKNLFCSLSLNS